MIAVLMVMSGMDSHTIRETWIHMVGMFGVGQLFFKVDYRSGLCARFDVALRGKEVLVL
jgi:hypothetical protein